MLQIALLLAAARRIHSAKLKRIPMRTSVASLAMLAVACVDKAEAADASAQAWPIAITGSGSTVGTSRIFTFGSSSIGDPGVSATQTITSATGPASACLRMGNPGAASVINTYSGVLSFIEPDMPGNSVMAGNCVERDTGYISSFVFNKPVIAPIFHAYNLDASRMAITGASTSGAAVALQAIAKNNLLDVSGSTLNNTVQQATQQGCNNNTGTDTTNGACGSFRITAASGLVKALTLNNNAIPGFSGTTGFNDAFNWTVSFPTAPLTKQFSPAAIATGETSQLTFSIANPNQSGSVTLTPLDFTDNLPSGMTVASSTVTNNGSCGTPSVTDGAGAVLAEGATAIRASNISVAPGATCAITVTVTASAGSHTNDASNMSSSVGNLIPSGSATLTVTETKADLSITKDDGATTYIPGLDVSYKIVVSNNGPASVSAARVSDPLPAGITSASWTCGGETNGGICGATSGTGAIDTTADLPAGASVTYTFNMGVPPSFRGNLTNTAMVTPPAGSQDTNTSNNTASDTDMQEPPPVSGVCSPRMVAAGRSFTLAPLPITGTMTGRLLNAGSNWQSAQPWYTEGGGDYVITWTFSQPVPADWLQFSVLDVNPSAPAGYNAAPPSLTITTGAGSTATAADFTRTQGDLAYSNGALRYVVGGPLRQSGYLSGNSTRTVTSLTITSHGIAASDNIGNQLFVRPSCLTVSKVSQEGTGSFQIDMTNVVQANGTGVPNTTLTTTTAGTAVSSSAYNSVPGRDLVLSEVVPAEWNAQSAVCTDQNAGRTGNPTVIGSFASPAITIPAANMRPESDIQCRFTNVRGESKATVKKELIRESLTTNNVAEPSEVLTYKVTITHAGGGAFKNFDFIENIPNGATMTRVNGADGFTTPVAGASTVQLTVPEVPVGGVAEVEIDLTVAAPIPLGVSQIRNFISGGDVPADCAECSVVTPTPPYMPVSPPTVSCSTAGAYFNTAYNGRGGIKPSGADDYWQVAVMPRNTNTPPASSNYGRATIVSNPNPAWINSPYGNASWIAHNATGNPPVAGGVYDYYFRYQFNLDSAISPKSLALQMSYYSDNAVYQVWVNGVAQNIRSNFGTGDPYYYAGFVAAGAANGTLNKNWKAGLNEIVVQVKSAGPTGFLAQINSDAICQPKLTLRKEVVNDQKGTLTPSDFTLRATGKSPLTNVIEGVMGAEAITNTSIPGGTYTLAEVNQPGYVAGPFSCSIDGSASAPLTGGEVTLANGQNAICTITNDDQNPALKLEKTGTLNDTDGDGLIDPGETISYSFRVENTGNVPLTDVTVTDDLLQKSGVTMTPGPQTLQPGGVAVFTASYKPSQAEIDAGVVENTATATGKPPAGDPITSDPDSATVPPDRTPGLTIRKTGTLNDKDGDGLIDLGETVTYSFLVTNTGTVTLTDVTVNDPLVTVEEAPQTLAPNGTFTFHGTYTPSQADINAGAVSNTAYATGTPPAGSPIDSTPSTVVVPPDQTPRLTIDKIGRLNDTDSDGLIDPGETVDYEFVVTNTGTVTLTGVTIKDPKLAAKGITLVEAPQTLGPGESFTFHASASYQPEQGEIDANSVVNTATATGVTPSGDPYESAPDTAIVPPDQTPGLTIKKTGTLNDLDGDGRIDLGETLEYSFLVRNTGAVTLKDVTVADTLLADRGIMVSPGPQTLAPGGFVTFTATYTPTQEDINAGNVSNTATAKGTTPSGTPVESQPDTAVVPPDQTPGLTIQKTGKLNDLNGNDLLDPNESVSYSFLVTNTGTVTMTNVMVKDSKVKVLEGPQTLAPGESFTFTAAAYTPSQTEIDAGQVINTATAAGTTPSGTPFESLPDTEVVPPAQAAGLIIKKTGKLNDLDGDNLIDPDETISYSFRVTNIGAVTLANVTVDDSKVTVKESPQTLAPGESFTFTADYKPGQAELDAGEVTNTATAKGATPSGDAVVSQPDTAVIPPDRTAALMIDKTGTLNDLDGDNLIDLGETITYSFRVRNAGNVTLTNVTVNDPLLIRAGLAVSPGPQTLAPGGDVTFTVTYTPSQEDIDAGVVSNTATATGNGPDGTPVESTPDTAVVPPDRMSGLVIDKVGTLNDKDGDGLIDLGETISYTFLVKNTGNVTLKNVTVNDPLVKVAEDPQTLAPGGIFTFHGSYTPKQEDVDAGHVTNTAFASGTAPSGDAVKSDPDTAVVPPDMTPGLTIDKEGTLNDSNGNGLLDLGETINYTFLVRNTGAVTLTNVTVNDPLVKVVEQPQTLGPRGTFTFHGSYTPVQADIDAGKVTNTASATGVTPSGGPVESGPDTFTILADAAPGITIEKEGKLNDLNRNNLADAGEEITYTFVLKNTGKVTMTDVSVDDPMLAKAGVTISPASVATLAPGAEATFTATYTAVQADIDGGKVENTATGTGTPPTGVPIVSPPDTVVVPPDQTSGMTIEKTGTLNDKDGDGLLDQGESISYSFLVRNTGNVTLTNVTVNDPLLTNAGIAVTPGPQTLAPGGTATFTATYQPTQADIDAGKVENTATGTGTPPTGVPIVSPPDTVVVPPDQTSGMTIEKTGTLNDKDGDGLLDQGESISYSFLVRNTGNVTLTNVTVNDPLLANAGIAVTPGPQTLAPGASVTFTATYEPTQAEIDAGKVENTATGTGTPPTGVPIVSPPDTVVVPPDETASMTIDKQAELDDRNGNGLIDPGESIAYTFVLKNTGAVTLSNVSVDDPLLANAGVAIEPASVASLAPGAEATFRATYQPTQADIEAGAVTNTATGTGTPPTGVPIVSPPDKVVVPPVELSRLEIEKTGKFNDNDNNGYASLGDTITYSFKITNTGGQVIQNVSPVDEGPTFNGKTASGKLSAYTPESATLQPHGVQVFTATYALTQEDIDNAAGVTDGMANSATVQGTVEGGGSVPSTTSTSNITIPPAKPADITIIKQAGLRQIKRGEKAPFTIRVTNHSTGNAGFVSVTDVMPSGFRYVDGSATVDGVATTPVINGQRVRFDNVALGPNAEVVIRLQMLALSSAGPGKHTNKATVTGLDGNRLAPEARADIEIAIEPVFDCGDIVGKVFDDLNRNGYQDEGEPGLPGVRIATVRGSLVTTDKHGRFHVACADLPDNRIGSNFIMKLDTRTLPAGYRLTTENPRVIRLTAGKMSKLNFGASIGRVVRLDLTDAAFEPGTATLKPKWQKGIDRLIEALESEPSTLRIGYGAASDAKLARERIEAIERDIAERWKSVRGRYELTIETRVEAGQ